MWKLGSIPAEAGRACGSGGWTPSKHDARRDSWKVSWLRCMLKNTVWACEREQGGQLFSDQCGHHIPKSGLWPYWFAFVSCTEGPSLRHHQLSGGSYDANGNLYTSHYDWHEDKFRTWYGTLGGNKCSTCYIDILILILNIEYWYWYIEIDMILILFNWHSDSVFMHIVWVHGTFGSAPWNNIGSRPMLAKGPRVLPQV